MITLVGGNFEEHKYKESKVVTKLAKELFDESKDTISVFNVGTVLMCGYHFLFKEMKNLKRRF